MAPDANQEKERLLSPETGAFQDRVARVEVGLTTIEQAPPVIEDGAIVVDDDAPETAVLERVAEVLKNDKDAQKFVPSQVSGGALEARRK